MSDVIVMAQLKYASAIGYLMYLMQCIKINMAFVVSKMSRFTSNPNGEHWKAITKNFGYLLKNNNFGLHYGMFPTILEGYTHTSWISSIRDYKSITR